jgi:hypothetical protein
MAFRVRGLSAEPFRHLYGLDDKELAHHCVKRYIVNTKPGYPDRVEMRDVEVGEAVLLLNYTHQPADTPYRASHAIFIREGAIETYDQINKIPEVMQSRLLSLRAFGADHMLLDADVVMGGESSAVIERLFANPAIAYIHAHNAKQGCYAGRIERA